LHDKVWIKLMPDKMIMKSSPGQNSDDLVFMIFQLTLAILLCSFFTCSWIHSWSLEPIMLTFTLKARTNGGESKNKWRWKQKCAKCYWTKDKI